MHFAILAIFLSHYEKEWMESYVIVCSFLFLLTIVPYCLRLGAYRLLEFMNEEGTDESEMYSSIFTLFFFAISAISIIGVLISRDLIVNNLTHNEKL